MGALFRVLADGLIIVHSCFIVFVVCGALLTFRSRRAAWVHLPCVAWGVLVEFAGWTCPLTPLENFLRTKAGLGGFSGGFIEHYLIPVVYPRALTRTLQVAAGCLALLVNLTAYSLVLRGRGKREGKQ